MDIVFVRELKIQTIIGVFAWERSVRQTVVLDLEMAASVAKAAQSEKLEDALNYKAVCDRLIQFVEGSNFQLVETLAERIAGIVKTEFGVSWLRLRLSKPGAIPGARDVGVLIERGNRA